MVIRKQITLSPEVDRRLRRLAHQQGVSQSALIAHAINLLPDASDQVRRVLTFAGAIKDAPPHLSEEVDVTLYR